MKNESWIYIGEIEEKDTFRFMCKECTWYLYMKYTNQFGDYHFGYSISTSKNNAENYAIYFEEEYSPFTILIYAISRFDFPAISQSTIYKDKTEDINYKIRLKGMTNWLTVNKKLKNYKIWLTDIDEKFKTNKN